MKKLLVIAVLALLAIALVACGGEETPATTKGTDAVTTPVATEPAATEPAATEPAATAPASTALVTSTAPATTTTPETTVELPPVEKKINELMDDSWWQEVHAMNSIAYTINQDGTKTYTWSLTVKAESGLFPWYDDDGNEDTPSIPSISFTDGATAKVYIKDINKDEDFTEYTVSGWRTERWCDIWFVADGFVPTADGEYDMYLFFTLPDHSAYPGETAYIWALEQTWKYNAPVVSGNAEVDAFIDQGYHCNLHRHNEKYLYEHTNASKSSEPDFNTNLAPNPIAEADFPLNTFNFTIKAEDKLFPDLASGSSWQNVEKEGAFVYIKGQNDTDYARYEIGFMYLERWCDMWFTLEGFTPVAGEQYDMYVFFYAGTGATNPNMIHYVHATDWIAGAPVTE